MKYTCQRCGFTLHGKFADVKKIRRTCTSQPTTIEKVKNFGKSMVKLAKNKFKIVSKEEQKRRLDICKGCEFFKHGTCEKCGCVTNFKTKLESENCPIGKW